MIYILLSKVDTFTREKFFLGDYNIILPNPAEGGQPGKSE
jgi:hypothetical protein